MHTTPRGVKMIVSADGKGLVSQSGGLLLTRTLAVTGLGRGLSASLRSRRSQDPHLPRRALPSYRQAPREAQGPHPHSGRLSITPNHRRAPEPAPPALPRPHLRWSISDQMQPNTCGVRQADGLRRSPNQMAPGPEFHIRRTRMRA